MSAVVQQDEFLNPLEYAFIRAVLEHRGVRGRPTEAQFAAMLTLQAFAEQREDNPPDSDSELRLQRLGPEEHARMLALAWLEFGVTKPTPGQWRAVHRMVFGPLAADPWTN